MPEKASNISIGQIIRTLREGKGWSLSKLADVAGLSKSYLSQIEKGESAPTKDKIMNLANALGAMPSELLGEKNDNLDIPQSLREFAEQEKLNSAEIQMLARIQYRGKRPSTTTEWRAIYSVIRGIVGENN